MEYVPHATSTMPITHARFGSFDRGEASHLPGENLVSVIGNSGNTICLLPFFTNIRLPRIASFNCLSCSFDVGWFLNFIGIRIILGLKR